MINIKFPKQDVPNFKARNELVSAVLSLETDAVEEVLAKGIDIDMDVARDKSSILVILCATYGEGSEFGKLVCRNNDEKEKLLEMIDFLLKKRVDINKTNLYAESALSYAATAGDVEVVRFLHSQGAVPHNLMMRKIRERCHESAKKLNLIQHKRYNDILEILNKKSIEDVKPFKRKLSLLKKIAKARVDSEKEGEILPKIKKKNTVNLAVAYLKAKAKKSNG